MITPDLYQLIIRGTITKECVHDRAGILNVVLDMVAKNQEVDAWTSLSFRTGRLVLRHRVESHLHGSSAAVYHAQRIFHT